MRFNLIFILLFSALVLFAQEEKTSAPNFTLQNLEGDDVELASLVGDGPILISFWATWCKPCLMELKYFNQYYKDYKDDGLKMLAISTDSEKSVSKVRPYIRSNGYEFPVLLDTNSEVARAYYAQMVPFTVILDKSGSIVYSHMGYKKGDELKVKEIIENLLSES